MSKVWSRLCLCQLPKHRRSGTWTWAPPWHLMPPLIWRRTTCPAKMPNRTAHHHLQQVLDYCLIVNFEANHDALCVWCVLEKFPPLLSATDVSSGGTFIRICTRMSDHVTSAAVSSPLKTFTDVPLIFWFHAGLESQAEWLLDSVDNPFHQRLFIVHR